jgi:hypothetical protein
MHREAQTSRPPHASYDRPSHRPSPPFGIALSPNTVRFLPRAFMGFGWNIYAPDAKTRKERYAAPRQASIDQIVKSRSGA